MGFITRDIKKYLNIDLDLNAIDTLQMARDLYPDKEELRSGQFKQGLWSNAGKSSQSSRWCANATAKLFLIFLEKYKELGANTLPISTKQQK